MAARLLDDQKIGAELVSGRSGEFSVWVKGTKVAEKTWEGFPSEEECLDAIREELGS